MMISCFTRIKYPPHSPDFGPRNFCLFGCITEKLKDNGFSDEEELSFAIQGIMTMASGDFLLSVFSQSVKGLRDCMDANGDYVK
jgi:hypothetical protein